MFRLRNKGLRNGIKRNKIRHYLCKGCENEEKSIKRKGINLSIYKEKLDKQNGVCAICFKNEKRVYDKINKKETRLAIDHNHSTGKVRGLLCLNCNLILGYAEDDIDVLNRCIEYLKLYKD